ncbi:SDR family NAD(P)-dependent oxidoreductase [Halovulum dunhuangense]|uniref:SDR family NAD(P)-dependent oxidoreductase n=2 Tax=Halovulum dunhuangense TaxID=1505036 RepID=A0A849L1A9_9RHOB|nr:SDR family NAD(P)-dependent oxidoreductase [Halovulum dunhuangense]NNU80053.1 SDR family NAD(P)-dependent oxidoreductase [Halovulum dunhuangense]
MRPADGAAWITGASGGIGRAVALRLAAEGWTVYATARSAEKLELLAAEATGPGRIVPMPGDVADAARMAACVAGITAEGPLALAILNAGIYTPMRAQNFRADTAAQMLDVNLKGVTNALEPLLEHMIARGDGHLAITASVAGYRGLPDAAVYSATKAGLIAMCEALAMDLVGLGVRITVINPGFVATEATSVNEFDMPFLMQPDEAATRIVEGLKKPGFELAFPRRFALILKTIGLLPNRAYIWVVRKALGWDKL